MTDDAATDGAGGEVIGYAAALAELDDILHELDGDEIDVDVLGARVRRAAELLRVCRDRISSARFEVEQVVAELEAEAGAGPAIDPSAESNEPGEPTEPADPGRPGG